MRMTDEGASSVEYGLILAAICAVIIVVVYALGAITSKTYEGACDQWAKQSSEPDCATN